MPVLLWLLLDADVSVCEEGSYNTGECVVKEKNRLHSAGFENVMEIQLAKPTTEDGNPSGNMQHCLPEFNISLVCQDCCFLFLLLVVLCDLFIAVNRLYSLLLMKISLKPGHRFVGAV